ncbi:MarR family winged helix-turn-helix transcriptional regulator [Desulfotomaculum sp. 1211_IL3151]|uniref:MarR family winged helix-turn-helix transcriptional regulator n=1 Tax=Desulfotomaculum sp. 1211_IL3151 TaxID=3084055 RepID=UPI002FD9E185
MKNIAEQISRVIEDIWIIFEKKERAYTNFKLNNQQHVLLTMIMRHPHSSPTELAEKMDITKSAISQQIAKLEKGNYVIRKRHTEDKRTFSIELGEKGLLYKKETEAFYQQVSDKYYANMSPVELVNTLSTLQKLRELLES